MAIHDKAIGINTKTDLETKTGIFIEALNQ